jgi:hypothetical protein
MNRLFKIQSIAAFTCVIFVCSGFTWGFFAHQHINRLSVFTLPVEMIGFYKKNITYITEASVNPDKRRYAVSDEAPRHYLDLDHYGDSALHLLPHQWPEAVKYLTEDTLKAYGILPWHIHHMYLQLKDAFLVKDPDRILRLSAELGHYIADAHVPLHTTENYNGQLTDQVGIHGFWESRLPELFFNDYDFFVGKASHLSNPQAAAWDAVESSYMAVDSVLLFEKELSARWGEKKYSFETRGSQTVRVYAQPFSKAYHNLLDGMIERRMRASVRCIGNFWYTAWVDAGQPDLKALMNYKPTEAELERNRVEVEAWKKKIYNSRDHDDPQAEHEVN